MCPKDDNQVPGPPLSFILLLNSHLPPQAAGGMNGWLSDQPVCSGYKCRESCQGQAPHGSESLTGKQPGGEFSPPPLLLTSHLPSLQTGSLQGQNSCQWCLASGLPFTYFSLDARTQAMSFLKRRGIHSAHPRERIEGEKASKRVWFYLHCQILV